MWPRHTWVEEALPAVAVTADLEPTLADLDPSRLVILAGAGISVDAPSWLPTAERFLSSLYAASLPQGFDWPHVLSGPAKPRFELVVDIVRDLVDPQLEVLRVFRGGRPNTCHRCIAALAARGALVVTTNFDALLERALGELGPYTSVYEPEGFERLSMSIPTVWHLHGILEDPTTGEPRPASIVASIRDCWTSREWFRLDRSKGAFLQNALVERDLLVVGYSGADDYDIAPCLEGIASERRLIWVDHAVFDPAAGPPPTTVAKVYEGDCWYRDPGLNSLAAAVYAGNRAAARTRVLKYKTSHVLQALSGESDPEDPVSAGPRGSEAPRSLVQASDAELRRWAFGTMSSTMLKLRLEEQLLDWSQTFLPNEPARYRVALRLARAQGLTSLVARLQVKLKQILARSRAEASGTGSAAAAAIFIVNLTAGEPARAARALDRLGPEHAAWIERPVMGLAETQLALAEQSFLAEYPAGRFNQARSLALEAREHALAERLPSVLAVVNRLLARMAEREGRPEREVEECYVDAVEAAQVSGEVNLIAVAQGELGIYLVDRLDPEVERIDWEDAEARRRLWSRARMAFGPLSKAYRIHVAQGDTEALTVVAAKLGICLSYWPDQHLRSLRAHLVAYLCLDRLGWTAQRSAALEWIRSLVSGMRGLPVPRGRMESTQDVETLLSWLDRQDSSLI